MIALNPVNLLITISVIKHQNTLYNLPKDCGESKNACLIYMRPTDNLQSHLREIFRINERWYDKLKLHRSTTNKRRLVGWTYKIFYIDKKYIGINKADTFFMIFHKTMGRANTYVRFVYRKQTIFNHTQEQLSVSMNDVSIKAKKQDNNQIC